MSHAPVSTPWRLVVWRSGVRWAIAQCCEESKTAWGMAPYAIRKYAGWHHPMLTTMLAHFFLWHWQLRVGKKSAGVDGVAVADLVGRRLATAAVDHGRCASVGRVGAEAQSPGLSSTPQAAARERRAPETAGWSPRQTIFVGEKRFYGLNLTLTSAMPGASGSLSCTRCPGWGSHAPRRQGTEVQQRLESISGEPRWLRYNDPAHKSGKRAN